MKQLTAYSKPGKCPNCGYGKIDNILYNIKIAQSKEFNDQDSMKGENCIARIHPRWQCTRCNAKIFLRTSRRCRINNSSKA